MRFNSGAFEMAGSTAQVMLLHLRVFGLRHSGFTLKAGSLHECVPIQRSIAAILNVECRCAYSMARYGWDAGAGFWRFSSGRPV